MNKASSFFSKFFACIFACLFALFFLIIVCIFLFRNMFTYDNVFKYVSDAKVFDSESYEILSNGSSKTLRDSIHKDLLNIGIPETVTDNALDSNEVSVVLSNYLYGYYNYVLYNTKKVSIDENKIISVIQDKYLINQGKMLTDEQLGQLQQYLKLLTNKVDNYLFSDSELNELLNLNIVRVIASGLNSNYVALLIGILIILMIILISICLQSLLRACRWCSKMICLDGIILVITSLLEVKVFSMFFNSKGIVDNLVISVVENGFTGLLICGIVLVVVGIILIVVSGVLLFKKSDTKQDDRINNVIDYETQKIVNDGEENVENDKDVDVIDNNIETIASNEEVNKEQDNLDTNEDVSEDVSKDIEDSNDNVVESVAYMDDSSEDNDNKEDMSDELPNDATEFAMEYDTEIVEDADANVENQDNSDEDSVTADTIEMESVSDDDENNDGEDSTTFDETQYTEIFDNDSKEEIEKRDIELEPLTEVNPDIVYPEKGEDIKVNLDETEEEEIEIL